MSIKKIAEKAGVSISNRITYPEPAGLQMFSAWPQRKSLVNCHGNELCSK